MRARRNCFASFSFRFSRWFKSLAGAPFEARATSSGMDSFRVGDHCLIDRG
jgi:hypothetical protein